MTTLLIVEDDPTTQELLVVLLQLEGYHVLTTAATRAWSNGTIPSIWC